MDQHLQLDYNIVNNPKFESGLVKILNKDFSSMPRSKNIATIGLKTITSGECRVVFKNSAPAVTTSYF